MSETKALAARHWDAHKGLGSRRWWHVPACVRMMNATFGVQSAKWGTGLTDVLARRLAGRRLERAISVGCGTGIKEMALVQRGIVGHFDLYEISTERIKKGRALFAENGLSDRLSYREGDGLKRLEEAGQYDLVFWDNSLHHMPDTRAALEMSAQALRPGGFVYVNEYVGENRFQWSEAEMIWAQKVRDTLPDRFFSVAAGAQVEVSRHVIRPTIEAMLAADPTESADSAAILPALRHLARREDIWLLGGVIYHLALSDVLANFRPEEDDALLASLLLLDNSLSQQGLNHYAAALVAARA